MRRLSHPELVEQDAVPRVVLEVPDPARDEVGSFASCSLSRVDPALEDGDPVLRPSSVARHRPRPHAIEDRSGVPGHLLVRPQVERKAHRSTIEVAKERLDVLREADRLAGSGELGVLLRCLLGESRHP